jgi:putative ABC transport system permease protein
MSRFYRALLHLYPGSFRVEYGGELERTFTERSVHASSVGKVIAAVTDVVPNAIAAHWAILLQDLAYTARSLRGARGFATTTILVTALGVGANTATFSVADYVLRRPLAFPHPDELVRVCEGPRTGASLGCMNEFSPANFRDVARTSRSFAAIGAFTGRDVNVVGAGEPIRVPSIAVTSEVLPLLGVQPLIGRFFDLTRSEDANAAVMGYGLWQSHFGGDPAIVGKTVSLDGQPYVVVGVMPPQFLFPSEQVQLWTPLIFHEPDFADRNNTYIQGVARLEPGVSFEHARTELNTIADRMTRDVGKQMDEGEVGFSFFKLRDVWPQSRTMLLALCGASLGLLLLTCASLANLLLARASGRELELAVRAALGAGRERLIRQMLTESLLLALLGGIAGAALAWLTVPLLAHLVPNTLPIAAQPSLNVTAFGIAAVLSALTGLAFGLVPALRVAGRSGLTVLREGARGGGRRQAVRTALVAVEVSISVVLLISSGLLIRAVWRVQSVDPGFSTTNVLTMNTALPSPKYDDARRRVAFYERVLSDVRALPGVVSAAYTSGVPMVMTGGITRVRIPGEKIPRESQTASIRVISSQLFSTLNIPLRRGRDIMSTDGRGRPPAAVVSESFAKRYWPAAEALGQTFISNNTTWTVVGVVGDIKTRGLERTSEPQMYVSLAQADSILGIYTPKALLIRSANGLSLVGPVREIIRKADPQQPISNVRMLADVVGDQTGTRRSQLRILVALSLLALLIAAVGIHGLLAFTVAQRDREIGVRLALGAKPAGVWWMVMSAGVRTALLGLVPGVAIAFASARAMTSLLFGVPAADPITFSVVATLCFATVLLACMQPAWRAARISVTAALRGRDPSCRER